MCTKVAWSPIHFIFFQRQVYRAGEIVPSPILVNTPQCLSGVSFPKSTRHPNNVGPMLGQRRRWWRSIGPTLCRCLVCSGVKLLFDAAIYPTPMCRQRHLTRTQKPANQTVSPRRMPAVPPGGSCGNRSRPIAHAKADSINWLLVRYH